MELEPSELFIENLLDFSSDIGEDGEDDDESKKRPFVLNKTQHHTNTETNNNNSAELTISDSNAHQDSFPGLVEEELEWLSNEDAFPPIESFDILSLKPNNVPKNPSPVSVLENSSAGLRVPVQARSKRRRRRRSSFSELSGQQWWYCYEPKNKNAGATRMSMSPSMVRRCLHCQAEKTPQWRAGPLGPKTLCNACGVRYKSGRLVPEYRPASSPSFSDELHSNSHRKILDMRKQKQKEVFYPSPDNGHQWWYCYEPKKKNVGGTRTSVTTSTVRRCRHCQAKKTPQWREGPLGPRTLCNACGVRYRSGRLEPEYRPASSPSFSDEQHSNSHRKILDMRKQQKQEGVFSSSPDNGR